MVLPSTSNRFDRLPLHVGCDLLWSAFPAFAGMLGEVSMLKINLILACTLVSCTLTRAFAQDPASKGKQDEVQTAESTTLDIPPGKSSYLGRKIAPTMGWAHAGWLIRSEREQEEDPQTMLEQLQLKPGMVVCDLGCGNGFYSLEMARRVAPDGKVLAVDIQQEMLHLLELRADEAKIENIETILGSPVDPKLPEGKVDLVLMVDVYHELSHPEQILTAIHKALKPKEGRIALVEFRAEDRSVPILPLHKMSKKQILREYKANHFKLVDSFDKLPWQHLMFFEARHEE